MPPPSKKIRQIDGQSKINFGNTSRADMSKRLQDSSRCWRFPGFKVVDVSMDGNCMFASIAHQLYSQAIDHELRTPHHIRNEVVNFLQSDSSLAAAASLGLDQDDTIMKYCDRMRHDKIWGDGNVLTASACLYKHPIWVYTVDNEHPIKIVPESDAINAPPLTLGYVAESQGMEPTHYISLIACNDGTRDAQEQSTITSIVGTHSTTQNQDSTLATAAVDKYVVNCEIVPEHATHIHDIDNLPVYSSGLTKVRKRQFCVQWYEQYPWLHWQNNKLLCHTCLLVSHNISKLTKRYEDAFLTTGFCCNWKKAAEKFAEHSKSSVHKEAVEKLAAIKGKKSVLASLVKQQSNEQCNAQKALLSICTTLHTLAKTGCAIRGHVDATSSLISWLQLRAEDIPELQEFMQRKFSFVSHDVQNELLQLMSNNILRQILQNIRNSQYYSIMVDETTDCSTHEQVSICVRYLIDDIKPAEKCIGMFEVSSTTGQQLAKVILDVLCRCDLKLSSLRAQCYDGAANMSGRFNGVQSHIRQRQPLAMYVHCYAHNLNLVLQETCREVPVMRDCLEYLHRAAVLMGRSAKRKAILDSLSVSIKALCPTRWSVRAEAVKTALANYVQIMDALSEVAEAATDSSGTEASGLLEQFKKSQMYWALHVAVLLFEPADRLSKNLQSVSMNASTAMEAVKATYAIISSVRTPEIFNNVMEKTEEARQNMGLTEMVTPRTRKPPRKLDSGSAVNVLDTDTYYRQQFYMIVDKMCNCLDKRFTQNADLQSYISAERLLLTPVTEHEDLNGICHQIASQFPDITASALSTDLQLMDRYLQTTSSTINPRESILKFASFMSAQAAGFRCLFPELMKLLQLLSVIPATSATAERSFSALKRVKSWLRSTMSQTRLNSVLLLHMHRELVPDMKSVLCEFIGLNDTRRRIFGDIC